MFSSLSHFPGVCFKSRRGLRSNIIRADKIYIHTYTWRTCTGYKGEYNSCEIMLFETLIFFFTHRARPPTMWTAYVEKYIMYFYLNLHSAEDSLRAALSFGILLERLFLRLHIDTVRIPTDLPESNLYDNPPHKGRGGTTDFRFYPYSFVVYVRTGKRKTFSLPRHFSIENNMRCLFYDYNIVRIEHSINRLAFNTYS